MNYLIFSLILMPFLAAPCSYLLGQKTKSSRDLFFRFIVISEFLLALLLFIQTEGAQQRIFSLPGVCGNRKAGGQSDLPVLLSGTFVRKVPGM